MSFRSAGGLVYMTVLDIGGRIDPARVGDICTRAAALLATEPQELICDVRHVEDPDAATIDALAHVQLLAQRAGQEMWIRGACDQLRELIAFMGLASVLRVEPRR